MVTTDVLCEGRDEAITESISRVRELLGDSVTETKYVEVTGVARTPEGELMCWGRDTK